METVYIILLFVAPGMIVRELTYYFVKERRLKDTVYAYLFDIVVDSFVINGTVIAYIMNKNPELNNFTDLMEYLSIFKNLGVYIICLTIVSIIWCILRNFLVKRAALRIKNILLKADNKPIHTLHTNVWDDLTSDKNFNDSWKVVSLYKDEKYLTSGMINTMVTTNAPEFEIMLDRVTETKEMMKVYPEIFKIDYEYYNVTTGFRVIVYKQEDIEERWDYEL